MKESNKDIRHRTFSSSELASISGVSEATQRDWRRRGIERSQSKPGWKKYSVQDLAFFSIVKLLTSRGVVPRVASKLAKEASGVVLDLLIREEAHVRSKSKRKRKDPPERFVVAAGSKSKSENGDPAKWGFASIPKLNSFLRSSPDAIALVVVDLTRVADRILERVPSLISKK